MKIVDCFIFYNEIELLRARFEELYDVVDYFVLVESKYTFTNINKDLFYNKNKEQFNKYNDKVIHIIIDKFPDTDNVWHRESYQRSKINDGIKQLSLSDEDIIIISDVDEIINRNIIIDITNNKINIKDNNIYNLEMTLYYYTLEWTVNNKWYHSILLKNKLYNKVLLNVNNLDSLRLNHIKYKAYPELEFYNIPYEIINNAGWHITYFGDSNFIINKLESFSEQKDNNIKNKDKTYLNNCITNGTLHFNNKKLIKIPIESNKNIPQYFIKTIPKIAFTFWEGTQLSILHYLTLYTFSKYNPDYKIILYHSNKDENFIHINKDNIVNKIHASGFNFNNKKCININEFTSIKNLEIINIDVEKEYDIKFTTSPIHKADIIRICKLYEHGGLWIDLDIFFIKSVPDYIKNSRKDLLMFNYSNTIATGLIAGTPKNKAIQLIYTICLNKIKNSNINSDWQQFGPTLWMTCYKLMNKEFNNSEFLDNNEIYPYMWYEPKLFFESNINKITDTTWGIHWYNGNVDSRRFIDTFTFDSEHINKEISVFYNYLYKLYNT